MVKRVLTIVLHSLFDRGLPWTESEKDMIESKTNTNEEKRAESEKKMNDSKNNTDEEKRTGEKELTASSSTLPCMDRLREELSCAVRSDPTTLHEDLKLALNILNWEFFNLNCV